MNTKRLLTLVFGLIPLVFANAFAQTEAIEVRQKIEQLRLQSSQASDQAKECDQNASNEDRLAQTGPAWTKVIHQLAAVKFRDLASQNRENAGKLLAQAQELERQNSAQISHSAPAPPQPRALPAPLSAPGDGEDYLRVAEQPKIEGAIEAYLNRNGMKASVVTGNGGAIHFVLVGFAGSNGMPNILYKISALPPISSGTEPQSQLIGITLETNVKASATGDPLYAALGEANKIGNCAWFVDSGEVKCRTWVGIPASTYPIPAEEIRQKIRMINGDWLRFSPPVLAAAK